MSDQENWLEKQFDFDFPISRHVKFLQFLRQTLVRLEAVLNTVHGFVIQIVSQYPQTGSTFWNATSLPESRMWAVDVPIELVLPVIAAVISMIGFVKNQNKTIYLKAKDTPVLPLKFASRMLRNGGQCQGYDVTSA